MHFRHSVRRKDGKKHVYWRLVGSVRRDGKVVQETVWLRTWARIGRNPLNRWMISSL